MFKVAIIMGSKSDWPVVKKAAEQLEELEIPTDVHIYSAHRTPNELKDYLSHLKENQIGVVIAAAGMAAHLAGAIAAQTVLPVIGLPLKAKALDGMDALLSTVQMPPGIPVATVGIDSSRNAALIAAEILAIGDEKLTKKLQKLRLEEAQKVIEVDKEINEYK